MIQVMDSGLQHGQVNNAMDRHDLAAHAQGVCVDRLRFYRSLPSGSVGCHQVIDRELRIDYCHDHNIAVVRRPTGGGAIYLDPQQLGWSLIIRRSHAMGLAQLLALFVKGLVDGLNLLGIVAYAKHPNDVEIDGRKIATLFMACEADSVLVQGTVLLDADIRTMLETLRVPTEKLSPNGLSAARERLITVKECLGEIPALATVQAALTRGLMASLARKFVDATMTAPLIDERTNENLVAHQLDWRDQPESVLEAMWKTPGGTLRARAVFHHETQSFAWVEMGGDIHLQPSDGLIRLQHLLQGVTIADMPQRVMNFFHENQSDLLGFTIQDVTRLLHILSDKLSLLAGTDFTAQQLNALMVYSPRGESTHTILSRASVMLVPYCAKPLWCKWRFRDGCTECGLCEVGEAYRLAREREMQVTTITHYEHLAATLTEMKLRDVQAYIGMCCSSFFIKRHRAFQEAGMSALLMDISGANCYELKQEEQAYAGQFQAQAELDMSVLQQVIKFVPQVKKTINEH